MTTRMMKQRPIAHHLVAMTSGKQLITWGAGFEMPNLRALTLRHRL
jgi:hypothetical protein